MSRSKQVDDGIGEPIRYDPRFNGPLKRRSCTDIICLLLFIVFIGCWIGLGAYAFVNGDPNKLLIPRDSNGSRCGFDAHVLDKPYLFFFDLTQCIRPAVAFTGCPTPQVCVASCPTSAYIWDAFTDASQLNQLICWYGENPTTLDEARDLVNVGRCARWALPSTPVLNRCLYKTEDRRSMKSGTVASIPGDEISHAMRYLEMVRSWVSLFIQYVVTFFSDNYDAQKVLSENVDA